ALADAGAALDRQRPRALAVQEALGRPAFGLPPDDVYAHACSPLQRSGSPHVVRRRFGRCRHAHHCALQVVRRATSGRVGTGVVVPACQGGGVSGYRERSSGVPGVLIWSRPGGPAATHRILPDGCVDLILAADTLLVAGPDTSAQLSEVGA